MARDSNFKILKRDTKLIYDHGKGNPKQSGRTIFYVGAVSVSRLIDQNYNPRKNSDQVWNFD